MRWVLPFLLLCTAAPAVAQDALPGTNGDARFQTIEFVASGIFHLRTSPEVVQTVLFASGERIRSVLLSDPNAYMVSVAASGDGLTLKPNSQTALAIMSVRTERRSYEIELAAGGGAGTPQLIRFSYGNESAASPPVSTVPTAPPAGVSWRLSGDAAMQPASISDDGKKIYIAWHDNQAMPAVFSTGAGGKEQMVDGYVRAGVFTIDRIYGDLVFRIDSKQAVARRIVKQGRARHD